MKTASIEIQRIIPYDETAGIMDSEARNLGGIGKTDSLVAAYNSYYRTKHPAFRDGKHVDWSLTQSFWVYDWRHSYSEFAEDFVLSNGMYKSLIQILPGCKISLKVTTES
jgi:hypothetical protein